MNPYVRPRSSANPGRTVGDINDLLATTAERWRSKVFDTYFGGHVFLKKLLQRARVSEQGGEQITTDLEVAELKAGGLFAPYSKLDIRPNQILTTVSFPWKADYQMVSFSTQEMALNMGNPRVINLVKTRYANAQKAMAKRLEAYALGAALTEVFGDDGAYGTSKIWGGVDQSDSAVSADANADRLTPNTLAALNNMRWNGLADIISADTPQGGLAANALTGDGGWYAREMQIPTKHGAVTKDTSTTGKEVPAVDATTATAMIKRRDLDYMYMLCTRGGMNPPDMGLTDYTGYLDLKDFFWTKREIHSAQDYELGFGGVMLNQMPVNYTDNEYINRYNGFTKLGSNNEGIDDNGMQRTTTRDQFTLYYINFDAIELITKSGHWQKRFGPSTVPDRPAVYHRFESMGNLVVNNRRFLGKIVKPAEGTITRHEMKGGPNDGNKLGASQAIGPTTANTNTGG